jgi:hypothetical protein
MEENKTNYPKTASIHPKFVRIGEWTFAQYKRAGFRVLDIAISATGPMEGYTRAVDNEKAEKSITFNDAKGNRAVLNVPESRLRQIKLGTMHFNENTFDTGMAALREEYPYHTFVIRSLRVQHRRSGTVIKLVAKKVPGQGVKPVVTHVDDTSFKYLENRDIILALGKLFFDGCEYRPGNSKTGFICSGGFE